MGWVSLVCLANLSSQTSELQLRAADACAHCVIRNFQRLKARPYTLFAAAIVHAVSTERMRRCCA